MSTASVSVDKKSPIFSNLFFLFFSTFVISFEKASNSGRPLSSRQFLFRRLAGISSQPGRVAYRSVAEPAGHLNPCFVWSYDQVVQSYRGRKKDRPQPDPCLPPYNPFCPTRISAGPKSPTICVDSSNQCIESTPEVLEFPPRTRRVVGGQRLVTIEKSSQ
jgi:hypothetical protein